MWVVAPRVRSGIWLRCGGERRRFLPSVRVRGARGRGRALVAARAAATAAHLPAVPLALSRSRLACQLYFRHGFVWLLCVHGRHCNAVYTGAMDKI
jgi:hypothetical protein